MRRLVRETALSVNDLVYPLFIREGEGLKQPIKSMTDCFHFSPDTIAAEAKEVAALGIPAVLLFGLPAKKDDIGSEAWSETAVVQRATKEIKKIAPGLLVITDVCLCEYTSHGHCGVIKDGNIDNDATCELLAKMALSHAQAGADIVAPSDMMDGRVRYIREALEENGFHDTAIMSYAAKYASRIHPRLRRPQDLSNGPRQLRPGPRGDRSRHRRRR
jgi:porphobilinogen synthase